MEYSKHNRTFLKEVVRNSSLWKRIKSVGNSKREKTCAATAHEAYHVAGGLFESRQSRRFSEAFENYQSISRDSMSSVGTGNLPRAHLSNRLACSVPASVSFATKTKPSNSPFFHTSSALLIKPHDMDNISRTSFLETKAFAESLTVLDGSTGTETHGSRPDRVYWNDCTRSTGYRRSSTLSGSTLVRSRSSFASATTSATRRDSGTSDFTASILLGADCKRARRLAATPPSVYSLESVCFEPAFSAKSISLRSRSESAYSSNFDSVNGHISPRASTTPPIKASAIRFCQPVIQAKSPLMAIGPSFSGRSCIADLGTAEDVNECWTPITDAPLGGYLGDILDIEEEDIGQLSRFVEERLQEILEVNM